MNDPKEIPEVKSLRWLAYHFPPIIPAKDDGDRICNCVHAYAEAGARKIEEYEKKRTEAVQLMESVIDTLIEVGNGVTEEKLHIAASDLMKARDLLG